MRVSIVFSTFVAIAISAPVDLPNTPVGVSEMPKRPQVSQLSLPVRRQDVPAIPELPIEIPELPFKQSELPPSPDIPRAGFPQFDAISDISELPELPADLPAWR